LFWVPVADTSGCHPFYIPVAVELITEAHQPEPMVAAPSEGRVFGIHRRPQLADCAPSGRIRLDALARWMQDIAYADVEDVGLERVAIWVLRRSRIRVSRFPSFGEHCEVRTFCSGIGRMWAERRTTVTLAEVEPDADGAAREPLVEAVALWVHLDPDRRLPSPVTDAERDVYGAGVGGRKVLARLRHPRPEHVEAESHWHFRHTDADIADHVNNAAYWEPLEDELLRSRHELTQIDAELEFRTPAQPGTVRILTSGTRRWITGPDGDEVYASTVVTAAVPASGSN
jgi:acyl-ACP thioesterase